MAVPEHEQVPKAAPGTRRGRNDPVTIMARIVQVGQMIVAQGMTVSEIYNWNMADKQVKEGWGYSAKTVSQMAKKARDQGRSLLAKNLEDAIILTIREWYSLKRQAIAAGEFAVAAVCVKEIAKIRGTYIQSAPDLARQITREDNRSAMEWAKIEEPALAGPAIPVSEESGE